jgi:hypothetical protein
LAEGARKNGRKRLDPAKERSRSIVLADAQDWRRSETMDDQGELADDRE